MTKIDIKPLTGSFAENKDVARDIRLQQIIPAFEKGDEVTLDFAGIDSITQSFCHALLSELIRNYGVIVLDRLYFANCEPSVRSIIEIVVDYMQ